MTTKTKLLSVIKDMKKREKMSSYGFRTLPEVETNVNGLKLLIQANSMAFCEPQEDIPLDEYSSLQISFKMDDTEGFTTIDELPVKIENIHEYLVNDMFVSNTYGNVPINTVDKIYRDLTESIKVDDVKKPEIKKEVKKETKKEVKKTATKKKITKKQAVTKINEIINVLNSKFFEMEDEISSLIISFLAKEHVLMVGLPGIAKSDLAKQLGEITSGEFFDFQLQPTTTPDEIFGSINHEEYIRGNVERNLNNKLATAEFAHLDEIFKANSATLNSMLQVLNERTYDNNGKIEIPLITAIGASNEFPYDDGLSALYDRFLIRHYVAPLKARENRKKMLKGVGRELQVPKLSLDDLYSIHNMVEKIKVEDNILDIILDIVEKTEDEGLYVSPRRYKRSLKILQAKAFIEGRNEVIREDLIILKDVFWDDVEDKALVTDIVERMSLDKDVLKLNRLEKEIKELINNYQSLPDDKKKEGAIENGSKLKNINVDIQNIIAGNEDNEAVMTRIKELTNLIKKEQSVMMNDALAPIE